MSDAAHIRSTRWEPQLDAEKIHELGGRILRLLHCEKILHGFHFQATLFKLRMPWNLSITATFIVLWHVCQKGSNGGCIVSGLISLKVFRPYLPLDMEAMPDPGFLALHGTWELLKSDHQIIRSSDLGAARYPPRFPSINLVLVSVSQVDGVVRACPNPFNSGKTHHYFILVL